MSGVSRPSRHAAIAPWPTTAPGRAPVYCEIKVEVMDRDLAHQSRRRGLVQAPVDGSFAIGRRRGAPPAVLAAPLRVDDREVAQDTALDELEHVPVERVRASLQSALEDDAGRGLRRGGDRPRVVDRVRDRRLAVDVLSSPAGRRRRDLAMQVGRRGDDDRVDAGGIQHAAPVGHGLRLRRAAGGTLEERLVDVAQRGDLRRVGASERVHDVTAPRAETDDAEAHGGPGRGGDAGAWADASPCRLRSSPNVPPAVLRKSRRSTAIGILDSDGSRAARAGRMPRARRPAFGRAGGRDCRSVSPTGA